jgi:hypothetical protein
MGLVPLGLVSLEVIRELSFQDRESIALRMDGTITLFLCLWKSFVPDYYYSVKFSYSAAQLDTGGWELKSSCSEGTVPFDK